MGELLDINFISTKMSAEHKKTIYTYFMNVIVVPIGKDYLPVVIHVGMAITVMTVQSPMTYPI